MYVHSSYHALLTLLFWWHMCLQNGRISSMDFHRASSYLVTASDDESIRLYDVAGGTYAPHFVLCSNFVND